MIVPPDKIKRAYVRYALFYLSGDGRLLKDKNVFFIPALLSSPSNFKKFVGSDRNLQKIFHSAFKFETTPEPDTLNMMKEVFNIPLDYDRFYSEIYKDNPSYLKYLNENLDLDFDRPGWEFGPNLRPCFFTVKDEQCIDWIISACYLYRSKKYSFVFYIFTHPYKILHIGMIDFFDMQDEFILGGGYFTESSEIMSKVYSWIIEYLKQHINKFSESNISRIT